MQPSERQLHLGLDARNLRDTEAGRLPGAVMQEGRLADSRLPPDDEHPAVAAANVLQQPVERLALAGSAQQHRRARGGHRKRKRRPGMEPRGTPGATSRLRSQPSCVVVRPTDTTHVDAVAIVTGGSCGIGREVARKLASRGYAVVVVYLRDQAEAEAAVEEILAGNGTALAVRADVTDELDVERLFDETKAVFGGVDVVVHTATDGTAVVNRLAARQLRHGGAIVSVSRSDAIAPELAHELSARDVMVNGVAPGLEPPGADHAIADLLAFVDRWQFSGSIGPPR
jgi:3-oxoacyl-[acyl-carrier protein] reductase